VLKRGLKMEAALRSARRMEERLPVIIIEICAEGRLEKK
jgi:hypothetical protein